MFMYVTVVTRARLIPLACAPACHFCQDARVRTRTAIPLATNSSLQSYKSVCRVACKNLFHIWTHLSVELWLVWRFVSSLFAPRSFNVFRRLDISQIWNTVRLLYIVPSDYHCMWMYHRSVCADSDFIYSLFYISNNTSFIIML